MWYLSKQDSTRQLGINEVLTPQQQSQRNALWSTYQQARAQGHRASFLGGCLLYINDQPWDLPGQQQQLGQVAEQYFPPLPCPPPQQPPQMLYELSGPSQTLHMNPSAVVCRCPADASRPSVPAHPENFSAVPALAEHSRAAELVPYP